jgi:hypothetical protein
LSECCSLGLVTNSVKVQLSPDAVWVELWFRYDQIMCTQGSIVIKTLVHRVALLGGGGTFGGWGLTGGP